MTPSRSIFGQIDRELLIWIAGGAVFGFILVAAGVILLPILRGPQSAALPTPVLTVIPLPSETMTPAPSPTAAATEAPTATSTPPPASGEFAIGQLVVVSGTEGEGLRLRQDPSLESEIRYLAIDNEVFEIRDGPVDSDGYTWWFVVNPFDEARQGWGVSNFLRPEAGS